MNNLKLTYSFLVAAILINFSGLFITIIGPDGAIYASIAKTMAIRNDYTDLFIAGKDWLDKPHFPFWITAVFFEIFGIHTWSYKLPGILIMMMGAYYTYRFAKELYTKEIALWSAIILLTAQHIILSNNDVRAEPFLTGFIIASIYHFYKTLTQKSWLHLVAGALFAALAIMTKGLFTLVPIVAAIGGEMLMKKQWKDLFHLRWLVAAILTLLFITPELYTLYTQFDMHPEKLVFDTHGVSGIRFFFWDSQFGRFFNTGPIKGSGNKFFFFHTVLWAFLPWSLLLYAAFIQWFRKCFRNPAVHEWFCFYGSLATFLIFSLSKFQLPHYITIIFPLFAILTAQYLFSIKTRLTLRIINTTQTVIVVLLVLLAGALLWFFRPEHISWLAMALLLLLLVAIIIIPTTGTLQKALYRSVLLSLFINVFLNVIFYPNLLRYQSGSEAAWWINENYKNIPVGRLEMKNDFHALNFYLDRPLLFIGGGDSLPSRPFILYGPSGSFKNRELGKTRHLRYFIDYPVSRLTPKFLNKATRAEKAQVYELILAE